MKKHYFLASLLAGIVAFALGALIAYFIVYGFLTNP